MPIYYTYKNSVPLLPGQTLGFTPGKGYYAKGTSEPLSEHGQGQNGTAKVAATQPKPAAPPLAGATLATPVDRPTVAQPSPAPTAPKTGETTATTVSKPTPPRTTTATPVAAPAPVLTSDARSSGGYGSRYYTYRKQAEANLKPGEKVGFISGRGYYVYYPTKPPPGTPTPKPSGVPTWGGPARFPSSATDAARTATAEGSAGSRPWIKKTTKSQIHSPIPVKSSTGFNRQAELAYVARWNGSAEGKHATDGYNPKYEPSRNAWGDLDDCTNFVSQALHAGGWSENSAWNYQRVVYLEAPPSPFPVKVGGASSAWENVQDFVDFAVQSGRATIVPVSKAEKGDVIVADWNGGTPGTSAFRGDHTMIVTGRVGTNLLIASHGSNRYDLGLFGPSGSQSVQGQEPQATFIAVHVIG